MGTIALTEKLESPGCCAQRIEEKQPRYIGELKQILTCRIRTIPAMY
ncbi:hypothetical protein [Nitrosomonas sp.]|nr:hypothetical protein [Nitrosomonas sp.]MCC6917077.1 hypothetical protein [Nitrosomonas sp.]